MRSAARLHLLITLTVIGLGGLVYPVAGPVSSGVLVGLLVVLNGLVAWYPRRSQGIAARISSTPWMTTLLMMTLPVVILFGWIEAVAQVTTRNDLLPYHSAMQTMLPDGQEDWRLAHITADEFREPDPVLLWRPVPSAPYNAHRFKGPEPAEPKPPEVFRIMTYGDSNTDGPDTGGWPDRLQAALNDASSGAARYEVVNAGVAGYSSYQGLRRLQSEIDRYEPDLILVSFGWNDAAPAIGPPDRLYEPPDPSLVAVLRLAVRYRTFLVARYVLDPRGSPAPTESDDPHSRVAVTSPT